MSDTRADIRNEGRRRFLGQALRWTAALALGGGVAAVTARDDSSCDRGPCASCDLRADCRRKPNTGTQRQ